MKYICSLIVVEDIEKARHLYEAVLKQQVVEDYGQNIVFAGSFAIHKKEHFRGLIDNKPVIAGSNNFELYFEEDDLPAAEAALKACGLEFVHEVREQPWRQQVLRCYDYDKNIIEIGEKMEHTAYRLSLENLSIEEIARTTYLSEDAVKAAISLYSG